MKRFVPLSLFLVAAIVLFATLTTRQPPPAYGDLMGEPFPPVALPSLSGDAVVTRPQGVQVINFFASWCVPCRIEHPDLLALEAEGVRMLGIAWKDSPAAAAAYLEELDDPFVTVALDQEGRLGDRLGVQGAPETFVLNSEGQIIFHWRGPLNEPSMKGLRQALKETAG